MVYHTVLLRLTPLATPRRLDDLAERLRLLATAISGANACTVGPNVTEEPLQQGYQFGFILRFADRAALDAYLVNPAHLAISLEIRDLAETVLVFDFAD